MVPDIAAAMPGPIRGGCASPQALAYPVRWVPSTVISSRAAVSPTLAQRAAPGMPMRSTTARTYLSFGQCPGAPWRSLCGRWSCRPSPPGL